MSALTTDSDRLGRADRRTVGRSVLQLVGAALVLWAALCGIGWLLSHPLAGTAFEDWDGWVDRWFARHRTSTWNTVTHWLTYAAETYTVIAIGLVFFVVLRLALHRWRESMFLFAAVVGEVLIFLATTLSSTGTGRRYRTWTMRRRRPASRQGTPRRPSRFTARSRSSRCASREPDGCAAWP